ncbi:oxidoreductase [Tenacibaculum pacificus]|uniref:sialidase family protein n=1 Tax=Tenacibaculum pacificus TaxID=3018314 RepID=UPI0022F39596|nr:oxidoreductase [Tenacibaculum pacificus]WBX72767.1 oxidoreductase [Tenacibaculum pacificus]
MDSLDIRAIKVINDKEIYYASSNGELGYTFNGEDFNCYNYRYDSITPNYRSLAYNGTHFFALSIGNPALLYKYNKTDFELVYTEKHPKVFYDAIKFFSDKKHGIAVGDPTEEENCPSIILTSDNGNTWTKLPCSALPKFEKGEAFFAASNTNVAIINNTVWIASGGTKSRILKSTDYGNTWEIYNTPIIQGNETQGIYSIDFYDELNGIAIGGDYLKQNDNCANKAITSDGGKTWTVVADNQNPTYKSCVQYVPNTNGKEVFAVGKTGVSFSNDSGYTWKEINKDSYYTIQFSDKNTAWLSGHQKLGKLVFNNH